jgi:hypothetical protein
MLVEIAGLLQSISRSTRWIAFVVVGGVVLTVALWLVLILFDSSMTVG